MRRSILVILVFVLLGCQNQEAVSEGGDFGSVTTSPSTSTTIILDVGERTIKKVQLLQFFNGERSIIASLTNVSNSAEFKHEFEGLSLVYLKVSSDDKLIPIITDTSLIEIALRGEISTNSNDTNIMITLDEYYRRNMESIKVNPGEFIKKIDSVSPSFSGFTFLSMLHELSSENYKLISELAQRQYKDEKYAAEWVDFAMPKLDPEFLAVGSAAPDFTLKDPQGTEVKLSSFRGKVVLLDFWATWCGPCMHEMPNVKNEYGMYKGKGFEVVGVSLDRDPAQWKKVIDVRDFSWNHVLDQDNSVARLYDVSGIPFTLLLDEEGIIIGKNLRGAVLGRELAKIFID